MNQPKKKNNKKKKNPWVGRILTIFWACLILGVLSVAGIIYGASSGWFGPLPDVKELENPEINIASEIWSSDGVLLDRFEKEKRIPIEFDDLPEHLVQALYAREDIRYDNHAGIDGGSVLRAVYSLGRDGGGSTITQQLAKQLFTKKTADSKLERVKQKLKEWVVAVQLEQRYTKEEIITMYLNKFDFVYRADGIQAAARTYFQKDVQDLDVDESAVFIAMLRNPIIFNPHRNPEAATQERNVVLSQMMKYDFITAAQFDSLKEKPIPLNFQMMTSSVSESFSAYFKYAMQRDLQQYFEDYYEENGVRYDLYRDGLKIYTSIDSRMQRMGEQAIKKHLEGLQKQFFNTHRGRETAPFYNLTKKQAEDIFITGMKRSYKYQELKAKGLDDEQILEEFHTPRDSVKYFTWDGVEYQKNVSWMDSIKYHKHIIQAGLMAMDPSDGTIKTWVGGIDWDFFKYDHVKQARRQVGSTFKPFVYATAIHQMNYTPCHKISNERFVSGNWKPRNASNRYGGYLSLREGLARSVNMISARLISESGPKAVIQLSKDLGMESEIPENLTIALGSADLTLYEMVGAYSTFANQGIYIQPEYILRVEDKNGKVIKDFEPLTREVLSEDVAYTMIDLMEGVIEIGTGRGIRSYGITAEIAGKTGTTNEGSDSWFIGLAPNLVAGVWVGNEDRAAHFPGWQSQGAKMAMPIWAHFMKSVYDHKDIDISQSDKFEKPIGIDERWDCSSLQGFYNFGNIGSMDDNRPRRESPRQQSINEMLSSDVDTINFGL